MAQTNATGSTSTDPDGRSNEQREAAPNVPQPIKSESDDEVMWVRTQTSAAQHAIGEIRRLHAVQRLNDILVDLAKLDARPLSAAPLPDQLVPRRNPRGCCFDTASIPSRWTASKICKRCTVLNSFMLHADESTPHVQNLIGQIITTTDCICIAHKSKDKPQAVSSLPSALINLVVDFALEEMGRTKKSWVVRRLMHTSSVIRWRVVKAFAPVELWDTESDNGSGGKSRLRVNTRLMPHLAALIAYHFSDITAQQRGAGMPPRLQLTDFAGIKLKYISWTIIVTLPESSSHSRLISREASPDMVLTSYGACEALEKAFQTLDAKTWRFASPYERALDGTLGRPATSATIQVIMTANSNTFSPTTLLCRRWIFSTMASGPST